MCEACPANRDIEAWPHPDDARRPASSSDPSRTARRDAHLHLISSVSGALESIAPSSVRTGVRHIRVGDERNLWPSERAAISNAVVGRRMEFATGRVLLRDLLGANVEIPVGSDRRPRFPPGFRGTLAHDGELAVAAVTTESVCRAVGIDIEPVVELDEEVAHVICGPGERHLDAMLVFVLKEAAYKAWSSAGGRFLEHADVAVDVDSRRCRFTANVVGEAVNLGGRYAYVADRIIALVIWS